VSAVAAGSANIIATSEGKSGQATVSVTSVAVASVSVSVASNSINVGQTTQATAVTRDANNNVLTGRQIAWSSSNTSVATVNSSGLVTGVAPGMVTILATSEGKSGSENVSVSSTPSGTGSLTGTVTDPATGPVGGGTVEVLSGSTVVQSVAVQANGTFSVSGLAPGNYGVRLQPTLTHSLGAGEPAQRTASISSGQATTVAFTVKPSLYFDNFQSYTSQSQLVNTQSPIPPGAFFSTARNGEISSIASPSKIFLDATGGPNGSKAMRYDWSANGNGGTIQVSPRFNPPPSGMTSIAVRWTDKVSSLFTNGGGGAVGSAREYKWFLIKLGPPVAGTLSQIGVYLEGSEPNYRVTMDVTDRTNNINTTHAVGYNLPSNWRNTWHTWVVYGTNLGTSNATFVLYMDGAPVITISGAFLPGYGSVGGSGQLVVLELGSNINNGPDQAQSRWWREFGVYSSMPSVKPMP
jgi:hypothetical protein